MLKNNMKRILWFFVLFFIFITISNLASTYALFENDAVGNADIPVGKWIIKLNDTDVSSGVSDSFVIDQVNYTVNNNVQDGFIAPGRNGYFDIVLDVSGTEVSVRYDITIDINSEEFPENITFGVDDLSDGNAIKTAPNTYSGIISLDDLENLNEVMLRLNVYWDNAEDLYNDSDSELGIVEDNSLAIPVTVRVVQYLGEEIVPYE